MNAMDRLTERELAGIRRRRPAVRASLACEGMHLTAEEEALFEQFDREGLTSEQRRDRLLAFTRARRASRAHAAE